MILPDQTEQEGDVGRLGQGSIQGHKVQHSLRFLEDRDRETGLHPPEEIKDYAEVPVILPNILGQLWYVLRKELVVENKHLGQLRVRLDF